MSTLRESVEDYLSVRRALGYKLAENGRLLPDFVAYVEATGASTVTTELAVAWATKPTGATPVWWARRLAMVRGFARHMKAFDSDTEVPPLGLLPHRCRRVAPYLYSDADIAALMAAARVLPSRQRAATYETLIGLLAVTGMFSRGRLPAATLRCACRRWDGWWWGVGNRDRCGARTSAEAHVAGRGALSRVISSRFAARAAWRSWSRSSSWRRRSTACCSMVVICSLSWSMSSGAPSPD